MISRHFSSWSVSPSLSLSPDIVTSFGSYLAATSTIFGRIVSPSASFQCSSP